MDERTDNKPDGKIEVFLQDGARVIGRSVLKLEEDGDFLYVMNERQQLEALPKRLIVRYVAKQPQAAGGV